MRARNVSVTVVVAACALALVLTGPIAGADASAGWDAADGQVQDDGENATDAGECDYAALYEATIDGVVEIQVLEEDGAPAGLGSGFVYDVDGNATANRTGYVVTNQHVVADHETVVVEFGDGTSRSGEVVGTDVYSDLAVVAVDDTPEAIDAVPVADERPRPGERAAAFGSPFGFGGTITEGIVSGVDRSMPTEGGFDVPATVQTDAPIDPGNSGGPLVSCDGEVIGVNRAGVGENVGFAIGTPLVEQVVPELVERGTYAHPYLGVATVDLSPPLAEANGLETTDGVYVHATAPDGPVDGELAESTAFETVDGDPVPVGGDVIVAIDGEEIRHGQALSTHLATETEPGDEVDLTVIRDGEETTVTVTIGERPDPDAPSGTE